MFTSTDRKNLTRIARGIIRSKAGQEMSNYEVARRTAARYYGTSAQYDASYHGNDRALEVVNGLR